MNKLFLSLLLSVFCCLTCRSQVSQGTTSLGTITANFDGVPVSFNVGAKAGLPKRATNGYVIRGLKNSLQNADIIAIGVLSPRTKNNNKSRHL